VPQETRELSRRGCSGCRMDDSSVQESRSTVGSCVCSRTQQHADSDSSSSADWWSRGDKERSRTDGRHDAAWHSSSRYLHPSPGGSL